MTTDMTMRAAPSFLDRLVARATPAQHADASVLERRRPGLFEPRGGVVPSVPVGEATEDIAVSPTMPHAAPMPVPPLHSVHAHAPSPAAAVVAMASTAASPSPAIPVPPRLSSPPASLPTTSEPPPSPSPIEHAPSPGRAAPSHEVAPSPAPSVRTVARTQADEVPRPPRAQRDAPPSSQVRIERSVRVESSTHERVVESRIEPSASPLRVPTPPAPTAPMPMPAPPPPRVARMEAAQSAVAHPGRTALHAPAPRTSMSPAPVQVSIGRIEIRAQGGTPAASRKTASPAPRLGLDDYLRQRHGSG
jgi:hypothetical protein